MNKIHEKIMRADFTKILKRLIIFAVCVMLLGGGALAAMLAPQIGQAVSAVRQSEQDGKEYHENRESDGESDYRERKDGDDREERDFFDNMAITAPTAGAVITFGLTTLCGFLFLFLFWILIAAWLYQAAVRSDMNGLFWLAVGLAGNVFGAVAFLLVRSFIRVKCPACGAFQLMKARYCSKCGADIYEKCPDCGEGCAIGDKFCRACGKPLHEDRD